MTTIGVLTSGGDSPGMNAAIRAVTRSAIYKGARVVGFIRGYRGLIEKDYVELDTKAVSGILQKGGTILRSARCPEFLEEEGRKKAVSNLEALGVDGVVVIGGDGSLRGALELHRLGVRVVGIPASIDNDISKTDMAIGVDTALNTIIRAVDAIKDTASSHDRAFVIEVMGREFGYLAVVAAIACGAEYTIIPEAKLNFEEMVKNLLKRYKEGRSNSIIIVAEGAGTAYEFAQRIKDRIGFEVRISVLGHIQRGGSPSAFDRLLASRMGKAAAERILSGKSGIMIALKDTKICDVPLMEVANSKKRLEKEFLPLAITLGI